MSRARSKVLKVRPGWRRAAEAILTQVVRGRNGVVSEFWSRIEGQLRRDVTIDAMVLARIETAEEEARLRRLSAARELLAEIDREDARRDEAREIFENGWQFAHESGRRGELKVQ